MKEIRTTMLNAHFHCPYRYKKIVEAGGLEETEAMALGTKIHAILADLNKGLNVDLSTLSLEERKMVKNAQIFKGKNPIVEISMTFPISSEFELEGTADVIVDKDKLIHDYKTGYITYPIKSSLQLFMYFYLFYKTVKKLPSGLLTLDFVRTGMQDSLQLEAGEILRIAEKGIEGFLKDTSFEPRINPFCKYCPYALQCPLLHELLQNGRGPAKKFAANVLRYRITRLLEGADTNGTENVGKHATVVAVEKQVDKIDVPTAVSMLSPEELKEAVSALNVRKLPEAVRMLALKSSTKTEVVLDYDVTK